MKTIFCFSDTHGSPVPEKLKSIMAESDKVVFCGDGPLSERSFFESLGDKFVEVRGNVDGHVRGVEEETAFELEGLKILVTHGHNYKVKRDFLEIYMRARECSADLVLFGHTHCYEEVREGNVTLVNVGSLGHGYPSENGYCYIVVADKKVFANFVKIF